MIHLSQWILEADLLVRICGNILEEPQDGRNTGRMNAVFRLLQAD